MTADNRNLLISRLLTPRPSDEGEVDAIAKRTLWLWTHLAQQLAPLIGEIGFQSLYMRAMHLASPECAGLTLLARGQSTERLLQKLTDDLATMDEVTAQTCSNILLREFANLVASMIGEGLMAQILGATWAAEMSQANKKDNDDE